MVESLVDTAKLQALVERQARTIVERDAEIEQLRRYEEAFLEAETADTNSDDHSRSGVHPEDWSPASVITALVGQLGICAEVGAENEDTIKKQAETIERLMVKASLICATDECCAPAMRTTGCGVDHCVLCTLVLLDTEPPGQMITERKATVGAIRGERQARTIVERGETMLAAYEALLDGVEQGPRHSEHCYRTVAYNGKGCVKGGCVCGLAEARRLLQGPAHAARIASTRN